MSRESIPSTARQDWEWARHTAQEDINQTLDGLAIEIGAANDYLTDKLQSDPEKAAYEASRLVTWLNERWPYSGDLFMVSGKWHAPEAWRDSSSLYVERKKCDVFQPAASRGFLATTMDDEDDGACVRVGLSFELGQDDYVSPVLSGTLNWSAFAELHEVSLQYMQPGETEAVSSSLHEVKRAIQQARDVLSSLTKDPHSAYYQRGETGARERIHRNVVDLIDQVMPSPDSLDAVTVEGAQVREVYMSAAAGGEIIQVAAKSGELIELTGRILGFSVNDMPSPGKAGKSGLTPELCMVVLPYETSSSFNGDLGNIHMILPVRDVPLESVNLR